MLLARGAGGVTITDQLQAYFFLYCYGQTHYEILVEISWCMLFMDDIILIDEIKKRVNNKSDC